MKVVDIVKILCRGYIRHSMLCRSKSFAIEEPMAKPIIDADSVVGYGKNDPNNIKMGTKVSKINIKTNIVTSSQLSSSMIKTYCKNAKIGKIKQIN
jgi:hypothetical protein